MTTAISTANLDVGGINPAIISDLDNLLIPESIVQFTLSAAEEQGFTLNERETIVLSKIIENLIFVAIQTSCMSDERIHLVSQLAEIAENEVQKTLNVFGRSSMDTHIQ